MAQATSSHLPEISQPAAGPSTAPPASQMNGIAELDEPTETLLIDNFDSFTWNLYQYLCILGANVRVVRNDALSVHDFPNLRIKNLIISPGPGHPRTDSGISRDAIQYFAGKVPVLGVCMGLECIVDLYGGEIAYAGEIMHGKTSKVRHDGRGIFKGLPQGIASTRYHSLSASVKSLPPCLAVTSVSQEIGVIMGVRHRTYTVESVQYHPESIMSEDGDTLLKVFLGLKGGTWAENPQAGVTETDDPKILAASKAATPSPPKAQVPTILEKIYAQRIKDVALAKSTPGTSHADLETLLALNLAPPLISVLDRLKARKPAPALMAEIKRASPSKGDIALSANAAQQAITYALSGASVISVLTEPTWFKGSLLDMRLARQAVDSLPDRPAILRKDFICEEYQIAEARLHGADTVLLIVAMLPSSRLTALYSYSLSLGMEPLVEVNNAPEMERALALGSKIIGVNNRNLHDFEVDMGTTSRLATMVAEKDIVLCALSGITGPEDVRSYVAQGVGAVLVGEALMRAPSPATFIRHLLDMPEPQAASTAPQAPLVKICGVRTVEQALHAVMAGADFIGLVFAQSKRRVDLSVASDIVQHVRGLSKGLSSSSLPPSLPSPAGWFARSAHLIESTIRVGKRPLVVGVFQSQTLDEIVAVATSVGLDLVQLHGAEPAEWARFIPVPVIRAFHLPPASDALPPASEGTAMANGNGNGNGNGSGGEHEESVPDLTRPGLNDFILLDSTRPGSKLSGGAGVVVDWAQAARIADAGETPLPSSSPSPSSSNAGARLPIILAGGLTAENVHEAVRTVRPWAVDVSGGVETEGVKDPQKIRAFIEAAKAI